MTRSFLKALLAAVVLTLSGCYATIHPVVAVPVVVHPIMVAPPAESDHRPFAPTPILLSLKG